MTKVVNGLGRGGIVAVLSTLLVLTVIAVAAAPGEAKKKKKGRGAPVAAFALNADKLDNKDSTEFLAAGGTAADSDKLDGKDSTAFFGYGSTIPSGETITGVFGGREEGTSSVNVTYQQAVSFPIPAPADLTDATVNFKPSGLSGDGDVTCTGTDEAPTAPPGQVCLYDSGILGSIASGSAFGDAIPNNNSRRGFIVRFSGVGTAGLTGTWAYTAP